MIMSLINFILILLLVPIKVFCGESCSYQSSGFTITIECPDDKSCCDDNRDCCSTGLPTVTIVAFAVGGAVILIIIIIVVIYAIYKHKNKTHISQVQPEDISHFREPPPMYTPNIIGSHPPPAPLPPAYTEVPPSTSIPGQTLGGNLPHKVAL